LPLNSSALFKKQGLLSPLWQRGGRGDFINHKNSTLRNLHFTLEMAQLFDGCRQMSISQA
jgi:hypothetical protein